MALNSQIDRLEAVETQLKNTNSALKADNADFQVRVAQMKLSAAAAAKFSL